MSSTFPPHTRTAFVIGTAVINTHTEVLQKLQKLVLGPPGGPAGQLPIVIDSIVFVNKVQDKYPKPTSFTTMIIPFVNV
jgi:hypothetical protein